MKTPINDGLLQSDLDCAGFDLVNFSGGAGATGPEGPQGPVGPTGPAGADGADGVPGAQGDPGAAGPAGATGPAGPTGATGATGPAGSTGVSGGVASVFSRTGTVVAATNDYTFAQIGSKPTTLSGYGITDAQPLDSDLTAWAAKTAPSGTAVGTTDSQTLTTKTIDLASNTVTMTKAQLNTAISDGDAYVTGGTDVPITDGGTGVSTLPTGLLKGAGTSAITAATAGTDYLTPTGTETLTNKLIGDKLDITTVSQPATPSAGVARLYARIGVSGVESVAYLNTLGVPIVMGRDVCAFVKNTSGSTITKGSVVTINSSSASIPLVIKSQADAGMTKIPAAGMMVADIANNAVGLMMITGTINNVNTSGVGAGNTLYVSPTTAGAFTDTKPSHPLVSQSVGECLNSNATTGSILVNVTEANMGLLEGVNGASWAIGDGTGAGAKTMLFKNANTGTLTWTPTATRTITLPDGTGTVYITGGTDVAVADGGTGLSSGTSGGVLAFTASGTIASSGALAANAIVIGGGAGVAPSTTTTGTGVLTALGVNTNAAGGLSPIDGTATLTNKRLTKRVTSTAGPGATPTINTDNCDAVHLTALAAAITSMTTNLTGTPVEGDMLRIDFTDNGTARAIAWGAKFEASTVALPLTTVISTRLDVGFVWNTVTSKWRCIAVA